MNPPQPTVPTAQEPSAQVLALVNQLDAALPQTQCTRCGYADCRAYAQAMAEGDVPHNQCPPGGQEGVARLARILGQDPALPLNPANGHEGPRHVVVIDEAWCIGCTLCIKACPVDCIIGAPKQMHTVIEADCTGCELCIPACPVDCMSLVNITPGQTGWAAWSEPQAQAAKAAYDERQNRRQRAKAENDARLQAKAEAKLADLPSASRLTDPAQLDRKRAVIAAALARARAAREAAK